MVSESRHIACCSHISDIHKHFSFPSHFFSFLTTEFCVSEIKIWWIFFFFFQIYLYCHLFILQYRSIHVFVGKICYKPWYRGTLRSAPWHVGPFLRLLYQFWTWNCINNDDTIYEVSDFIFMVYHLLLITSCT